MSRIYSIRNWAGVLFAGTLLLGVSSVAADDAPPTPQQLLKLIQQQQRQIEQLQEALQKAETNSQKAIAAAEGVKSPEPSKNFLDKFQLGGVIEVEASHTDSFAGADSSDIALAKVEVFLDAQPTDWVSTHVQMLIEDGSTNVTLDEAWATIGNEKEVPYFLQAGQWAMPFTNDETGMVSDPLPFAIAETKEAAVLVGGAWDGLTTQAYVYNGDTQRAGKGNYIDQFGLFAGYEGEANKVGYNASVGFISNISDAGAITNVLTASGRLDGYTSGLAANLALTHGNFAFFGGYVTALDSFDSGDLAFNGQGAKPEAWSLEANYTAAMLGRDVTFALTYQGTDEALALSQPETRIGGAISFEVIEGASLAAEFLHDEDYGTSEGGTGEDSHTATLQLAVEF